jgi:hypothetical protein
MEYRNSALRSDPNLAETVLKKRLRQFARQFTVGNLPNRADLARFEAWQVCVAINRDLAVVPSVQAIGRGQPKTPILRGENGKNPSAG